MVFEIPCGSISGKSLGTHLADSLQGSIGAIVFVDDLRPNIAYELGYFHGKGRRVLLVTQKTPTEIWAEISDLAGHSLCELDDVRTGFRDTIQKYITEAIYKAGRIDIVSTISLPDKKNNMLGSIIPTARIPVHTTKGEYGPAIVVDTWGGIIFDTDYTLVDDPQFRILFRSLSPTATYSIYFRIRYIDTRGIIQRVFIGLTSLRGRAAYDRNERNLPAAALRREWSLLAGSIRDLMRKGEIWDCQKISGLEVIRVRAGDYKADPFEKNPAYEIGYLQIIGVVH